jgi:hypothetical protein
MPRAPRKRVKSLSIRVDSEGNLWRPADGPPPAPFGKKNILKNLYLIGAKMAAHQEAREREIRREEMLSYRKMPAMTTGILAGPRQPSATPGAVSKPVAKSNRTGKAGRPALDEGARAAYRAVIERWNEAKAEGTKKKAFIYNDRDGRKLEAALAWKRDRRHNLARKPAARKSRQAPA